MLGRVQIHEHELQLRLCHIEGLLVGTLVEAGEGKAGVAEGKAVAELGKVPNGVWGWDEKKYIIKNLPEKLPAYIIA